MKVEGPMGAEVEVRGADAQTVANLVIAGFFAIWMLDDLRAPDGIPSFVKSIQSLKDATDRESAMRVMRTFARGHPQVQRLLSLLEQVDGLPW